MSHPDVRHYATPLSPLHFLGPRLADGHCRFSLWCRDAETIDLLLFDHPNDLRPSRDICLTPEAHRFGDVWSVDVPGVKAGVCYVWRIDRPGAGFPTEQYILDPYAPAVAGAPQWGHSLMRRPGEPIHTGPVFPKGVVADTSFDWGKDRSPAIAWADMVVYETHVRGFTARANSKVKHPGTYAGLIEKVPYLKSLGVTSVELMPMFEFDEMEYFHTNDARSALRNFWGYSTLTFLAPNSRYAAGGNRGQQVHEFKSLVKALHAVGIEVILDVVYNHTAEGGANGPAYNFKVLDRDVFYIHDAKNGFHNYSGCGNTLNCNHPVVRQYILDSLRHWVTEYHVDGFRFDLAPILARDTDGTLLGKAPLLHEIDEDPILRGTKMIAEAWDAAGAYQVGSFPSPLWPEWNGRYRDDIRRFWAGEPGMLSVFATRLLGSEDLYSGQVLGPLKSVNFVSCHDGFTLMDLVSYREKRNEDNLESNRDGENHNYSANWGVEGPGNDPEIRELRLRMRKNLMATVLLSHGIPMFTAGDEFGRTQKGNNNAYCQDNELGWLDWDHGPEDKELLAFTQELIALRKSLPALRRAGFAGKGPRDVVKQRLTWHGPEQREPNWGADHAIGLRLSGKAAHTGHAKDCEDVFILFNASAEAVKFHMPDTDRFKWTMRLFTTGKRMHRSNLGTQMTVQPRSLVVFSAMESASGGLTSALNAR